MPDKFDIYRNNIRIYSLWTLEVTRMLFNIYIVDDSLRPYMYRINMYESKC